MNFITQLEHEFEQHRNREIALPMENYMKNNFSFLGIKAEMRRAIMKQCYQEHTPEIKENFREICWELFNKNEREYHIVALDLFIKEVKKNYLNEDIYLFEKMIVTHSWWDSVDVIAKYLVGGYLSQFSDQKSHTIERFSNSDNFWLNRTAILFQLSYKSTTDFELLKVVCVKFSNSTEFFIQKAIGWALRDYSRFNPKGVLEFVAEVKLKPLSKREAIRNIK
jgi:3-methyladenine DNA glycosylase AlkD